MPAQSKEERSFLFQMRIDSIRSIRLRLGQISVGERLTQAGFGCGECCVDNRLLSGSFCLGDLRQCLPASQLGQQFGGCYAQFLGCSFDHCLRKSAERRYCRSRRNASPSPQGADVAVLEARLERITMRLCQFPLLHRIVNRFGPGGRDSAVECGALDVQRSGQIVEKRIPE